jgi:hypothetical protein
MTWDKKIEVLGNIKINIRGMDVIDSRKSYMTASWKCCNGASVFIMQETS